MPAKFRERRLGWPAAAVITVATAIGTLLIPVACDADPGNPPPAPGLTSAFGPGSFLSSREFVIAISVLLFGLAMTVLATWLCVRKVVATDQVIRLFALMVIVTGTLFLVASGYDAKDIAPSMGLLGTIAGYLLGRTTTNATERTDDKPD